MYIEYTKRSYTNSMKGSNMKKIFPCLAILLMVMVSFAGNYEINSGQVVKPTASDLPAVFHF